MEEVALLLRVQNHEQIHKIMQVAKYAKEEIYGKRLVLFAPVYTGNVCVNNCLYCAFRRDNKTIKRKVLNMDEIEQETKTLLKEGHKRILLICGESPRNDIDYIYISADVGDNYTPFEFGTDHTANNRLENLLMKHKFNPGLRCIMEWADQTGAVHIMYSEVENGKLLLPIGAGTGWLDQEHTYVKIWVEKDGERTKLPDLMEPGFYHVRDIVID